jgi:hypothetical protein
MYKYDGEIYRTYEILVEVVMDDHPELLDDDLSDFIDSHVEEI